MNETPETNSVRIKIYDRVYVLRTDGDPEYLKVLGAALDERMHNISATTGVVDTLKVAVLAALAAAADAHRAREEAIKLDDAIGKRSVACSSLLDRLIQ